MFCGNYTDSAMVSKDYRVFVELGYPQLDRIVYEDNEWAIIEYYNAPLVPSLTKWKHIYKGFRNIEFNESFAKKLIRQIDPQYPEFWANELNKTKRIYQAKDAEETENIEWVQKTLPKLLKNENLMQRVARYGTRELNPDRIALAIAKDSPQKARDLGISVTNEHVPTGKKEILC